MSTVYTDTVKTLSPGQDLTIGTTGQTVTLPGNDLRVNTVKDKGGNTLWTSDGSGNISSVNAGLKGNLLLLNTTTASDTSSISFTVGSTYDVYIFEFINIRPVTSTKSLMFQGSTTSSYTNNIPQTTTYFYANHAEDGTNGQLDYSTFYDLAQSTNYQIFMAEISNAASASSCATLFLFSPGSTTYVKHYYTNTAALFWGGGSPNPRTMSTFVGGYFNTTEAMTQVNFKFDSGNISSGDFKMYGLL
jgi:hypothetical protein